MAPYDEDLNSPFDDWHGRVLRSLREGFQQRALQSQRIETAFQNGTEYEAEQQEDVPWLVENFIPRAR